VDDPGGIFLYPAWISDIFYAESSLSPIHLYFILMKKIIYILKTSAKILFTVLARFFLMCVYFLLFPFFIFVRLKYDFLKIKSETKNWDSRPKIESVEKYMTLQ
jgi:hypothetical protein